MVHKARAANGVRVDEDEGQDPGIAHKSANEYVRRKKVMELGFGPNFFELN
jgi:hypothetical protein